MSAGAGGAQRKATSEKLMIKITHTTLNKAPLSILSKLTNKYRRESIYSSKMMKLIQYARDDYELVKSVQVFAAHDNKHIIGWAYVRHYHSVGNMEFGVFVKQKYRRNNIGSKLIRKCLTYAKEFRDTRESPVIVYTGQNTPSRKQFYASLGLTSSCKKY